MPLLTRKRTLLAKIEATYGTDPTPTGAANAIQVRNMSVTPIVGDSIARDLVRPFLGASENVQGTRHVACEFEIELQGSGTAGTEPAFKDLLAACAMTVATVASTSNTYKPNSNSAPSSVTIYYNLDGVLHKITGARGTFKLSMQVNQIPVLQFSFKGLYNAPTDTAAPSVTYTSFKTPLAVSTANTTAFSMHGYTGSLQSLEIDLGNSVDYTALVGSEYIQISGRSVTGTAVFEAPTITAKDFFGLAAGTTLGSLSITHGSVAGSRAVITSSTVDVQNPTYADNNGVAMISVPFILVPSTTGNDELSIAFT